MNLPLKKLLPKLNELTATEIVAAIDAGQATCEAVVRACLEHIQLREPHVQAWQYLDREQAIGQLEVILELQAMEGWGLLLIEHNLDFVKGVADHLMVMQNGALITEGKSFPDNSLIVGSPARVIRTLDDKATAMIARGADIYVKRWQQYAKGLKRIG